MIFNTIYKTIRLLIKELAENYYPTFSVTTLISLITLSVYILIAKETCIPGGLFSIGLKILLLEVMLPLIGMVGFGIIYVIKSACNGIKGAWRKAKALEGAMSEIARFEARIDVTPNSDYRDVQPSEWEGQTTLNLTSTFEPSFFQGYQGCWVKIGSLKFDFPLTEEQQVEITEAYIKGGYKVQTNFPNDTKPALMRWLNSASEVYKQTLNELEELDKQEEKEYKEKQEEIELIKKHKEKFNNCLEGIEI